MTQEEAIERARQIKIKYEAKLLQLTNVVGVGIGLKFREGQPTGEVGLVVNVNQKKPLTELATNDIIPPELDGIPVDVQETGTFKAL